MAKRPPAERVPPTDEWGIYDPAKAGMQALYARLGRPVLRASNKKIRQERRRAFRPERERSADGVGLAIKEAMDRVTLMDRAALEAKAAEAKATETMPAVVAEQVMPESPARAVRIALKAAKPAKTLAAMVEEAAAPPVPLPVPTVAPAAKRKVGRRARIDTVVVVAEPTARVPVAVPAPALAAAPVAALDAGSKGRAPRKTAKPRVKAEPAAVAVPVVAAPVAPVPPAPSPRRPRGPVPLAAWAHAVTDAPKVEPRRSDKRGFWKGIFRIPSDVALVEYAHGCRIHRLLIETSDDLPMLDLL